MEMKRVVLITGANGGIGSATAELFASNNYNLILNYHAKRENIEKILKKFGKETVFSFKADVRNPLKINNMVEKGVELFGRIDVLVNNAGIAKDKTFRKLDYKMWNEVLDVNLNGTFNVTKAVVEIMIQQGNGAIINLSSIIGQTGNFGQTNYSSSKAGIIGFTKSLSKELASKGITVNAIAPGFVETHMTDDIPEDIKEKIIDRIPLKRFAKPIEIAEVILFLAKNKYITGSIIEITGGLISL